MFLSIPETLFLLPGGAISSARGRITLGTKMNLKRENTGDHVIWEDEFWGLGRQDRVSSIVPRII